MGVEQYQDYTLWINDDRGGQFGRHLTDEQLCADWQWEFPEAVNFRPSHVRDVRRDFAEGTSRERTGDRSDHGVRDASGDVVGGAPSQSHLARHGVGPGDLFLFFGLFRQVRARDEGFEFVPGTRAAHVLFGWFKWKPCTQ